MTANRGATLLLAVVVSSLALTACGNSKALPGPVAPGDAYDSPTPPAPGERVHAPLATTTRAQDDARGLELGTTRGSNREAACPDRPLSPHAQRDNPKVGEGWRYDWPVLTGNRMQHVFFLNRDNAVLSGTAFAPDPARCPGRRPLVVIAEGLGVGAETLYWWAGQSLAEACYVALTFDYMNHGFSEATGHSNPDGTGTPIPPTGGARGVDGFHGGMLDMQDALDFALSTPSTPHPTGTDGACGGEALFPFHDQVDPDWVGLAGHSMGARVSSVLQGVDARVDAIVAWDNLASDLAGDTGSSASACVEGGLGADSVPATPRVPAMGQAAPNNTECGDPQLKKVAYRHWQQAGQPVIQVVLANTAHAADWSPGPGRPTSNPWGTELPAHYNIAWFDWWLTSAGASARTRLMASSFDLFEHYNGPLTVSVQDALDDFYFSSISVPGVVECEDLRNGGCAP